VDLSALYLDIVKDRLYCEAANSRERRSAQTTLYRILEILVHLMAPVLSFTAEEIWEHMPKKSGARQSVFLSAMPLPDAILVDARLAASWDQVLKVRDEVLKALEDSRKPAKGENILSHIIGHSLDAEVRLYPDMYDSGLEAIFRDYPSPAWEGIFIVSKVRIEPGEIPYKFDWDRAKAIRETTGQMGSFAIIHVEGREGRLYDSPLLRGPIVVFKARGLKCERCWKYSEDVGKDPAHPRVCQRCSQVLKGWSV
jgi:isoleucyl-tRNA synthetase